MPVDSEIEKNEKALQTYAALGIGFVCIIVGLPLWWKTTEVYRVPLPYNEIDQLSKSDVFYRTDFSVVIFDSSFSKKDLAVFGEKLKSFFDDIDKSSSGLVPNYKGGVRIYTEDEKAVYEGASSIKDLDQKLKEKQSVDKTQFVLLPKGNHLKETVTWIGKYRNVFMTVTEDVEHLIRSMSSVLRDNIIYEGSVNKAFHTARGAVLTKADKGSMRALKSHPGYEVTFTLVNPEAEVISAEWQIQQAVEEYMSPLLDALAPFVEVNVKSQYLHYTHLGVQPGKNEQTGEYTLNPDQLPHIINPIEGYLSSHVSTNPNLNFVVYVTPRNQFPLYIYNNNDEKHPSNSFLSPRWGGILIYNIDTGSDAELPVRAEVDMKQVMQVFLYQLRLLLGINPQMSSESVHVENPGRAVLGEWELDQWLRLRTLENIATATTTLKSLAQLLEEISNIVINDDIGREVTRAVESINKAKALIMQGRITEGFIYARQALLSSEKAFFDPSLLELLYFPEDQKFAIYIPLFLPISIPVVMSIIQAIKRITGKDKVKQE